MGTRCTLLRGVDGRSHLLGANDVGHTLSVAVRARDSAGSSTAYASLVGPIGGGPSLVSTVRPAVSGAAVQGSTLHLDNGRWNRLPASFSYQWTRCNEKGRACAPIGGATADSYQIATGDLGHALAAIVQARSGATTQAVFSIATPVAVVTQGALGPTSSAPPLVAVMIQEGKTITGNAGAWTGSGKVSYAYQWYRCDASGAHCRSIHGATEATYTQVAKDVGQTLGLAVRASDVVGTTTAYASLIGPVAAAAATLVSTAQPTIAKTTAAAATLQVSTGNWSKTPDSFTYQWQRCNPNGRLCAPIAGATASTYTVTAADNGHTLTALVGAVASGGSQSTLSQAVAP